MMSTNIANSWWMYCIGAIVCLFVLSGSLIFIIKAFQDGRRIGMDIGYLKKTVIVSAVFSFLPSISILIGVIALSGVIGIPLPWIRLSVIGALHYEGTAVGTVFSGALTSMTIQQFVTIATVMTLGILTGPLYCLFGFKAYDKKFLSKTRGTDAGEKKHSFGPILFNAAFIAMISAFLAEDFAKLALVGKATPLSSYVPAIVIFISFFSMAILDLIVKKTGWQWLGSFSLGLSMLVGMISAIFLA